MFSLPNTTLIDPTPAHRDAAARRRAWRTLKYLRRRAQFRTVRTGTSHADTTPQGAA